VYQQCDGARLRSSRGPDVARVLRAALLEANGDASLPPSLSGHRADGNPTDVPHLAFVACPHVGFAYADGALLGCAIVLPRSLSIEDRKTLMKLVAAWERERSRDGIVELGGADLPRLRLERVDLSEKRALQPQRWCATSTRFVTATPIALDRHPGSLGGRRHRGSGKAVIEAQQSVADACQRIGLPRPIEVEISLTPFLEGAQAVREFPPWPPKSDRHSRARVHARVEFGEHVRGPVLLGAGRFFGLGLCLPIGADGSDYR
jgi:CRISPR-associated protein Csb2